MSPSRRAECVDEWPVDVHEWWDQAVNNKGVVMRVEREGCVIRPWQASDLSALVHHANDRLVWMQLRDRFPHPYRTEHGQRFLDWATRQTNATVWAIEVNGEAAGSIGVEPGDDVERVSAEVGYWLGRAHWGRGIVSAALRMVTEHAFAQFELTRIFALPFADNPRSIRVLEKAGYVLEGHLRQSAIKDGRIRDQLMYGAYRGQVSIVNTRSFKPDPSVDY